MERLVLNPGVVLASDGGGYLAYDVEADRLHHLNPTAALIVELCDGSRTAGEIVARLAPWLGEGGSVVCAEWIEEARRGGLLVSSTVAGVELPPGRLAEAADALRERGRVVPAWICRRRAAERSPEDPRMWDLLGELAHILGRRAEARETYERVARLRPDDPETAHLLIALRDEVPPPRASDACIERLYARFAPSYDESMCDDLDYRAPALLGAAVAAVRPDRDGLEVADLGCGTGLAAPWLRPRARRLMGVDLSAEMLARARRRGLYDDLEQAEITAWLGRATDRRLDLIVACDSLIYFGDLSQVVLPAARRLAKGGLLAFTVERAETAPFLLTDSGRYAHHPDHVAAVATATGLTVLRADEAVLRQEYGEPVVGLVVVLLAE